MSYVSSILKQSRWRADHQIWVEGFALANFLALSLDIYLAHSSNSFRRAPEYWPLYFSLVAPLVLAVGLVFRERWGKRAVWRDLGYLVGWAAILIGLAGVVLHLDSSFFYERTIKSLTYAAPFAAPLAYTGLGFVLIMNRMVDPHSVDWPRWLLLLTTGGFAGNLIFSLTDHATNGFYRPIEWLPVISSAFATSFLLIPLAMRVGRGYLKLCAMVLLMQGLVGIIGFILHLAADLRGPGRMDFKTLVEGAPPLAPLLFPNLVLLGLIALWVLAKHLNEPDQLIHTAAPDDASESIEQSPVEFDLTQS